jgi:hypothetical protein
MLHFCTLRHQTLGSQCARAASSARWSSEIESDQQLLSSK